MGTDSMAVVDTRLRVHGITGLRVIDASIMPFVPSGNTQAPVYMIGEKGAQMILDDQNSTESSAAFIPHLSSSYTILITFSLAFFILIFIRK